MHSKTNNGKHINGTHGKQINYNMNSKPSSQLNGSRINPKDSINLI